MRIAFRVFAAAAWSAPLTCSHAQGSVGVAATPSAAEVRGHVVGKAYTTTLGDGTVINFAFKETSQYVFTTSSGYRETGAWSTDDGKLCLAGKRVGDGCSDFQIQPDGGYLVSRGGDVRKYQVRSTEPVPSAFVGSWVVDWEVPGAPTRAWLVINADGSGSWRTSVSEMAKKSNSCLGIKVPVSVEPFSENRIRVGLRFAETLSGCPDATVTLFVRTDGSVEGRRSNHPVKLTKD